MTALMHWPLDDESWPFLLISESVQKTMFFRQPRGRTFRSPFRDSLKATMHTMNLFMCHHPQPWTGSLYRNHPQQKMTVFGGLSMIDHVTSMDRLKFYWDLHPTALDDVICSGGRMALSKQLQGGPTRDGKLTWSPAGPWGTCFFINIK